MSTEVYKIPYSYSVEKVKKWDSGRGKNREKKAFRGGGKPNDAWETSFAMGISNFFKTGNGIHTLYI